MGRQATDIIEVSHVMIMRSFLLLGTGDARRIGSWSYAYFVAYEAARARASFYPSRAAGRSGRKRMRDHANLKPIVTRKHQCRSPSSNSTTSAPSPNVRITTVLKPNYSFIKPSHPDALQLLL
ncbi:hypothetical protein BD410DRAFT_523067 [Rickenella mellea]|uniref:Uncharacterized protein n=1 Tax=Rickenella mellea TaxID=50990 RepID=A0A4Y7QGY3_9AGAM|nr:hypothetical protein BD410DRAFT_523067 [Rickenella mellea]